VKALLKLIHFEIHRFRHILFGLMGLTALVQIGATVLFAIGERVERLSEYENQAIVPGPVSVLEPLANNRGLYGFPVLICIVTLLLYVFLSWYREWFGKSTLIYRLLMLPMPRRNIYLAKLAALLVFIGSLLALQLVLLLAIRAVFNAIVPDEYLVFAGLADMINTSAVFQILLPLSLEFFVLFYGMGITCVLVLFTAVLLERGRRPRGTFLAAAYVAGMAVLLLGTIVARASSLHEWLNLYAYEFTWILAGIWMVAAAFAVWLGFRALNRTVSV
jgi:hypothetical protein